MLANIALYDDYTLNIKDTARLVGTSGQNIKKIAAILEKKGYAALKQDDKDARNIRLALTPKGKAYYRQCEGQERRYMEGLFRGFDEKEISRLYHSLNKLMANVMEEQGKTM